MNKNLRHNFLMVFGSCASFLCSDGQIICYLCIRVLDNLKDYAVRALVNAVDHLGTVAYKLTDLLEQQTLEVSTMELNVSCLNQVNSLH